MRARECVCLLGRVVIGVGHVSVCEFVCVHVRISLRMVLYIYIYVCVCVCVSVYWGESCYPCRPCECVCVCVCVCFCACENVFVDDYIYVCVCVCLHVCVCVCASVHACGETYPTLMHPLVLPPPPPPPHASLMTSYSKHLAPAARRKLLVSEFA